MIFPDLSNRIARWLGIDTGADLVFYVSIIIFYAAFIFLYSKFKTLEIKQTEMIRKAALEKAIKSREKA